jgi:CDP-diacylglycerol--serine O-phosphatidyltransferase
MVGNRRKIFRKPRLGSAVYVLPNLLTTGNLFFGFFSIVKCVQGDFKWAASAIVLAAVFDVLDGRVARLTGGTSEFGVQYDSLCDLMSFGLAPAFLMFKFGLDGFGRIGWILCFLFLACGALRLARFNVQSSIGKAGGDFTGLPIPMAAITIATFVAMTTELRSYSNESTSPVIWFLSQWLQQPIVVEVFMLIAAPGLAIAMVSNFAYRSHKVLKITVIKPFKLLVSLVLLLSVIAYEPELFGFIFSFLYAISGPFEWVVGWKKTIDEDEIFTPIRDDESSMEPYEHEIIDSALEAQEHSPAEKDKPSVSGDSNAHVRSIKSSEDR